MINKMADTSSRSTAAPAVLTMAMAAPTATAAPMVATPTYQPVYQPAYQPVYQPAYQSAYLGGQLQTASPEVGVGVGVGISKRGEISITLSYLKALIAAAVLLIVVALALYGVMAWIKKNNFEKECLATIKESIVLQQMHLQESSSSRQSQGTSSYTAEFDSGDYY